jgi:hypothetical protein
MYLTSLRRPLVFLLLGPIFGVLAALLPDVAQGGFNDLLVLIGGLVFLYSVVVSAVTGVFDGVLAHALPISLRAPLTGISGAIIAVGPVLVLVGVGEKVPQGIWMAFAATGALCVGACSLLSHDYRS